MWAPPRVLSQLCAASHARNGPAPAGAYDYASIYSGSLAAARWGARRYRGARATGVRAQAHRKPYGAKRLARGSSSPLATNRTDVAVGLCPLGAQPGRRAPL